MQPQGLPPAGVGFAEGHPVGQGLEVGAVEVRLELVACLGVEARLGVQAVDIGVDVHDEHRAVLAGEHVEVVDVQLAGLSRQRGVEVMGHEDIPFVLVIRVPDPERQFRDPGPIARRHDALNARRAPAPPRPVKTGSEKSQLRRDHRTRG
jgi:hypothetical protein